MRLSSAFSKLLAASAAPAVAVLLGVCADVPASAGHKPRPDLTIPLKPLGFGTIPPAYLQVGQTMFTLNFVDDTHLLVTFNAKGLLPRLGDEQPGDEDRNVAARLLELPSGKVVATTTWRTRDHGRYLWSIGRGRFLLRVRNHFSVVDPIRNLGGGDAFRQKELIAVTRRIALVDVSPDGGLLMVETAPPQKQPLLGAAASAAALAATVPEAKLKPRTEPPPDYQLRFYRLVTLQQEGKESVVAQNAGGVRARQPVEIAMTPLGYLAVVRESAKVYDFDFHSYSGKKLELAPFDTSCPPHAIFTSTTDFIAFGCRGGTIRNEMSAFNLRGEEPWISVLSGDQAATFLRTSPAAGRFALSLTSSVPILPAGVVDDTSPQPTEQVEVLQHHDGRVLLTVQSAPIQVAGQNFDLSPNGLLFAAVQNHEIGIYNLPPLSSADQKALTLSAAAFSEPADGPVRLETYTAEAESERHPPADSPSPAGASAAGASAAGASGLSASALNAPGGDGANLTPSPRGDHSAAASAAAGPTTAENKSNPVAASIPSAAADGQQQGPVNGDPQADQHRKPPSLYDPDHPKPPNQ